MRRRDNEIEKLLDAAEVVNKTDPLRARKMLEEIACVVKSRHTVNVAAQPRT